jgi:hypothetical protein
MSISLENDRAETLARQVAAETGESLTEAIIRFRILISWSSATAWPMRMSTQLSTAQRYALRGVSTQL